MGFFPCHLRISEAMPCSASKALVAAASAAASDRNP